MITEYGYDKEQLSLEEPVLIAGKTIDTDKRIDIAVFDSEHKKIQKLQVIRILTIASIRMYTILEELYTLKTDVENGTIVTCEARKISKRLISRYNWYFGIVKRVSERYDRNSEIEICSWDAVS